MKRRNRLGQSIVELCVGLIVLVPIMLVVFDLGIIVIGVQINDQTCREAARVAASGPPIQATATQRAQAVIDRANFKNKGMLSNYTLVSVTLQNVNPTQLTQAENYGGSVTGTVTVQTQVSITPFLVTWAYNGGQPLLFNSQQTFPFTYVYPNPSTAPLGAS